MTALASLFGITIRNKACRYSYALDVREAVHAPDSTACLRCGSEDPVPTRMNHHRREESRPFRPTAVGAVPMTAWVVGYRPANVLRATAQLDQPPVFRTLRPRQAVLGGS